MARRKRQTPGRGAQASWGHSTGVTRLTRAPHYDQHVWLWQANLLGMFAQWNPTVICPASKHDGHHDL